MVYMGSKNKYRKDIVPILQKCIDDNNVGIYIEPFCGSCSIIKHIHCHLKIAMDVNPWLIALLREARYNFDKIPNKITKKMWDEAYDYAKNGTPLKTLTLADVGAIAYFASFGAGGFHKSFIKGNGYPSNPKRDIIQERYENLKRDVPYLKDITFLNLNYEDLPKSFQNAVIYCDPPYSNTVGYEFNAFNANFNHKRFWDWVRQKSETNYVFVSEQNAPKDFTCIWEKDVKRTMDSSNNTLRKERLFVYNNSSRFPRTEI